MKQNNNIKLLKEIRAKERINVMKLENPVLIKILKEAGMLYDIVDCKAQLFYFYFSGYDRAKELIHKYWNDYELETLQDANQRLEFLKDELLEGNGKNLMGLVVTREKDTETEYHGD